MEQQNLVEFDHLISTSVAMKGSSETMSLANPFQQSNAKGELKDINSLDEIALVARESGNKLVAAFSPTTV